MRVYKINTSRLSEKAYQIIKEKLLHYEKGKYLSARDLSNEIGMSYTPVREAFLRLHKEGFLKRVPNVGFFVVHLEIGDIIEIFQVRECLENFVFKATFDTITNNEIMEMEKLIDIQKDSLQEGDIRQYVKADEMFHFIFFKLYGNKHFISLIKNVHEQYLFCSNRIAKSGSTEGINEHIKILEQIKQKNKDKATKLLAEHITNAKHRVTEGFIGALDL